MSDFAFPRESVKEMLDFGVLISEAEIPDIEQRRLKGAAKVIGFQITTPCLTKAQMQAYRDHIISKTGALTAFTFTSPYDDVEYLVRYVPGSFSTSYEGGIFQTQFEFKKVAA